MSWRFLVLVALTFTISLGRELLSSHAESIAQSSTQITPSLRVDYFDRALDK